MANKIFLMIIMVFILSDVENKAVQSDPRSAWSNTADPRSAWYREEPTYIRSREIQNKIDAVYDNVAEMENRIDIRIDAVEHTVKILTNKISAIINKMDKVLLIIEKYSNNAGEMSEDIESIDPSETITASTGILLSGGGSQGESNTEVFMPLTGKTCNFPRLPDSREDHTMDTVGNTPIICGGRWGSTGYSCLQLSPTSEKGSWTKYATLKEDRHGHTSWVSPEGIVLMGGTITGNALYGLDNTEIVNGGYSFKPEEKNAMSCAIKLKDYVIITGGGGYMKYEDEKVMKRVTKYNLQGHMETFPELQIGRNSHGCGHYHTNGKMVLMVTGGWSEGNNNYDSTETLVIGEQAWTFADPLPRPLQSMGSISLGNKVFIFGGSSTDRSRKDKGKEILKFDGISWKQVGTMQKPRWGLAVSRIVSADEKGFCV